MQSEDLHVELKRKEE
jgi:hypothetical protein